MHRLIYTRDMTRLRVTWLVYMCDRTQSYVWEDSFDVSHVSLICVTWLIHMCDMTHSYAWQDSSYVCAVLFIVNALRFGGWVHSVIVPWLSDGFMQFTRLICWWLIRTTSGMHHSFVCHNPFMSVTGLIHVCLTWLTPTPSCTSHDANDSCHTYPPPMTQMSHVPHMNEPYHTCKWVMAASGEDRCTEMTK